VRALIPCTKDACFTLAGMTAVAGFILIVFAVYLMRVKRNT
jgi:hypothetical protein